MIGLLGLDHETTSAEARGRLSFADERLRAAFETLIADDVIDEVVILSTCNRTEVYLATQDWSLAQTHARQFLAQVYQQGARQGAWADMVGAASGAASGATDALATLPQQAPRAADTTTPEMAMAMAIAGLDTPSLPAEIADALYTEEGVDAARRLFRVAAGLLSMVVGEAQILGQVREALATAEAAQTVGDELRALFTGALKAGKRARAETELGRADVSVAAVAAQVAAEALGGLRGKRALLIGAGRTNRLCAQLLCAEGIDRLTVANRTVETAATLAGEIDATPIALAEVGDAIANVDLVISATAAPHIVLAAAEVARGLAQRSLLPSPHGGGAGGEGSPLAGFQFCAQAIEKVGRQLVGRAF
jgi:glutamyl-tRNA reductase